MEEACQYIVVTEKGVLNTAFLFLMSSNPSDAYICVWSQHSTVLRVLDVQTKVKHSHNKTGEADSHHVVPVVHTEKHTKNDERNASYYQFLHRSDTFSAF